ncbi:Chymotrypsin BII [Smittium culicis]|uniref:Chymotrypsin BII n=1 Tax=Smittium culicis TaxID=133412 RepID=A0A1R1X9F5_9FUNG|nr:Chymotrypsin BII [Smittium culicis]
MGLIWIFSHSFFGLSLVAGLYLERNSYDNTTKNITNQITKRIIGGEIADYSDYSCIVSVQLEGSNLTCGGTLLSDDVVLTAAHCIPKRNGRIYNDGFYIQTGSADRKNSENIKFKLKDIHIYDNYRSSVQKNDIAILILEKKISTSFKEERGIEYAKIFSRNISTRTNAVALGWGRSNQSGNSNEKLLVTKIDIVVEDECKIYDYWIDNNKYSICTKNIHGTGICNGDSGGPLLLGDLTGNRKLSKNVLLGISAFSKPLKNKSVNQCDHIGMKNYFMNAYYYIDWISEKSGLKKEDLVYNYRKPNQRV